MNLNYDDIQRTIKELGPPPHANSPIYVSKELVSRLKENAETNYINIGGFKIDLIISNALPYNVYYKACCVVTRKEMTVAETIHAVLIPPIEPVPLSLSNEMLDWVEFYTEQYRSLFGK